MIRKQRPAERATKIRKRAHRLGQYRRHEVTDEQWEFLEPLIPKHAAKTGRKPKDPRVMLNGCLWILRTGAPWRDLPERFGNWKTVYDYYSTWRDRGVYGRILKALHIRLDEHGQIDWDLWCIDGSSVRAARAAAGASKKVSSGMKTSQKTTPLAARAADSQANSTWLLTARACP
jgi:transposase